MACDLIDNIILYPGYPDNLPGLDQEQHITGTKEHHMDITIIEVNNNICLRFVDRGFTQHVLWNKIPATDLSVYGSLHSSDIR